MLPTKILILPLAYIGFILPLILGREDVWLKVPCNKKYMPENCEFNSSSYNSLEDYDRCGPAKLPVKARDYFLAASGRRLTYKDNKDAYDRIKIQPKMLRDVSESSISTTVLGLEVDFPIGLSPVAMQKLAYPDGEKATVAGMSSMKTIMIVSSLATTSIEEIGALVASNNGLPYLWMQTYIFKNRSTTIDVVRRAEASGFRAIVLTSDSPVKASLSCRARKTFIFPPGIRTENINFVKSNVDATTSFHDITWLKTQTRLPIIAKGILSGGDAVKAILAGASAILVSNHGGRQIDGDLATIDALPGVVEAVKSLFPHREVYVDGGIRSGSDVFKAIARGARMTFIGRPNIWGLAIGGADGVRNVMEIISTEFNETMLLAGSSTVADIGCDQLLPLPGTKKESNTYELEDSFKY